MRVARASRPVVVVVLRSTDRIVGVCVPVLLQSGDCFAHWECGAAPTCCREGQASGIPFRIEERGAWGKKQRST